MTSLPWTGYYPLTGTDEELFRRYTEASPAAGYHPLLVSRTEGGTACRFLCSIPVTIDPPREYIAVIAIDPSFPDDPVRVYEHELRC